MILTRLFFCANNDSLSSTALYHSSWLLQFQNASRSTETLSSFCVYMVWREMIKGIASKVSTLSLRCVSQPDEDFASILVGSRIEIR